MSIPSVAYTPRPDAAPETECSTLSHIYKFVLDCHESKQEAAPESRPDDARKDQDARTYSYCT